MADYRTEEEQIEILKKWWAENGRSTLAGVMIALVGYGSWSGWQSQRQAHSEAAADLYQQLSVAPLDENAGAQTAEKAELAEKIRQEYADTGYAIFAALHLAQAAVEGKDFGRAKEMLDWSLAQKPDVALLPVIHFRLAQVLFAQGDLDAVIPVLDTVKDIAWAASVQELRGDVWRAQKKTDQARAAYLEALKALDASGSQDRRSYIEMKLSETGGSMPVETTAGMEQ